MMSPQVIVLAVLYSSTVLAEFHDSGVAGSSAPATIADIVQTHAITGITRTNYFRSSRLLDDETDFYGATIQLKAVPNLTDKIDGKVDARLTNPGINHNENTEGQLLEAYFTVHFEQSDIRIGKQVVAWGRADGINPTDNLTPRDYIVLLPFEEDQHFGTTALKLDMYLTQQYMLSIFMSPFFQPSITPLSMDNAVAKKAVSRTLSNSQFGMKIDRTGDGLDVSVSYYHGFRLLPDLRITGSDIAGPILEQHYDMINAIGADFARNYGRFGFRGELVYIDTADSDGVDPSVLNPYMFWVLGVDRTFLENFNLNVQFFQRLIYHFHSPDDISDTQERTIAVMNVIADGQRDRVSNGMSLRISNKWFNDTLTAELFTVINFTRHDSYIRPLLTYAFSDNWKGSAGYELNRGQPDTQFGSLKLNNTGFIELRYAF